MVAPLVLGLVLVAIFVVGALVVRQIGPLADYVSSVLEYADQGSVPVLVVITLINGIAEELFFRGAAYAAIPRHPVAWTTLAYFVATLATGNVMLAFAAILLGLVCGLQRRASGGVLAPIITHSPGRCRCSWCYRCSSADAYGGCRPPRARGVRTPRRSAARPAPRRGSTCR